MKIKIMNNKLKKEQLGIAIKDKRSILMISLARYAMMVIIRMIIK